LIGENVNWSLQHVNMTVGNMNRTLLHINIIIENVRYILRHANMIVKNINRSSLHAFNTAGKMDYLLKIDYQKKRTINMTENQILEHVRIGSCI
jgi:hypothetical protein